VATDVTAGVDRWLPVRGIRLHIREWAGHDVPFVLLHGLASNCLTWERVARALHAAGHTVITIDQRGHGLSDKPDSGYDFSEVTADLDALLHVLGLPQRPFIAGQSWGGNVVLDFAAHYPDRARAIALVDGGFLEPSARPGATWEQAQIEMRPPPLAGTPREEMVRRIRNFQPDWDDEAIEHTMGNFETLADGTIRPWLSLDHHMEIVRALWDHHPPHLYPLVTIPVLICPAVTGDAERMERKRLAVRKAEQGLARVRVCWFENTAHDIHVHRPEELARLFRQALDADFFA
jgi:pimeloyl-ACP methyl ester carboxylesterase